MQDRFSDLIAVAYFDNFKKLKVNIMDRIKKIIDEVANYGDSALIKWTLKFDKIKLEPHQIEIDKKEWDAKASTIQGSVFQMLEEASENIRKYSENQKFSNIEFD